VSHLAKLLRQQRRKRRLSLNRLARLSGISRRTLARLESGFYEARSTRRGGHDARRSSPPETRGTKHDARRSSPPEARSSVHDAPRGLSPRIALRLVKLLLPPDRVQGMLDRASARHPDDPYSLLPDLFPAFLFHDFQALAASFSGDPERSRRAKELADEWRREFAPDYADAFQQLINLTLIHSNLGRRLHAWRLQHDLSLVDTADLLDLSKSQLHRLERGERSAFPRTRFRILRLLTLPLPEASRSAVPFGAKPRSRRSAAEIPSERSESKGAQSRNPRDLWLEAAKTLLETPPPRPLNFDDDPDGLHRLRFLWLSGDRSTQDLAADLGISQPHLIRLLRGDRKPSRALREIIQGLFP